MEKICRLVITPFYEGLRQIAIKHSLTFEQLDSLMQDMTVAAEVVFAEMPMEKMESILLPGIEELKLKLGIKEKDQDTLQIIQQ